MVPANRIRAWAGPVCLSWVLLLGALAALGTMVGCSTRRQDAETLEQFNRYLAFLDNYQSQFLLVYTPTSEFHKHLEEDLREFSAQDRNPWNRALPLNPAGISQVKGKTQDALVEMAQNALQAAGDIRIFIQYRETAPGRSEVLDLATLNAGAGRFKPAAIIVAVKTRNPVDGKTVFIQAIPLKY